MEITEEENLYVINRDGQKPIIWIGNHPDYVTYMLGVDPTTYNYVKDPIPGVDFPADSDHSIIPVTDDGKIHSLLIEANFGLCDTARAVEYCKGRDPITSLKHSPYDASSYDPGAFKAILWVNEEFYEDTGGLDFIPPVLCTLNGEPVTNIRGTTNKGCVPSLAKLFCLESHNSGEVAPMLFAFDQWYDRIFDECDFSRVEFTLPPMDEFYRDERHRKASAGYTEINSVVSGDFLKKFHALEHKYLSFRTGNSQSKGSVAAQTTSRLDAFFKAAKSIIAAGKAPADGLMGAVRHILRYKLEMGTLADFVNICDDELSRADMDKGFRKFIEKLRIFWSESALSIALDRILMSPAIDMLKGGFFTQIICIGSDPIGGIFANLVRRLNLNPGELDESTAALVRAIYERDPELIPRCFFELDFSKYDALITHVMLLMCSASFSMVYKTPEDQLDSHLFDYLFSVCATNNAYKFAYVPLLQKMFFFSGRMSSGGIATSMGDSLVQVAHRIEFMQEKLAEALQAENQQLAYRIYCTMYVLLVALIYGDDRTEGIPQVVVEEIGLTPFKNWLSEKYGWIVKIIKPDIDKGEPMDYFEDAIGEVHFVTKGRFFVQVMEEVDSPSFLKTKVKRVFLDGKMIGIFPYRSTADLLSKLGSSLSAIDDPLKYLCSLISLGYLSMGNLEVYSIVKRVYEVYSSRLTLSPVELKSQMTDMVDHLKNGKTLIKNLPHSMRRIILHGIDPEFPSLRKIMRKHNINRTLDRKCPVSYDQKLQGYENHSVLEVRPTYEEFMEDFRKIVIQYGMEPEY